MTILITGGAGFIGSHTCIELLSYGYEILVVDNFSNSKMESLERVKELTEKEFGIYAIDLLDRESVENVFKENRIDAVIHFAGLKAVGESVEDPLMYYRNNITGTINLCEVMEENNVHTLVFSSSATVYGAPEIVPIKEGSKLTAESPYGKTKLMIEEILQDLYISKNKWSISILRYFNPIGAHESGQIGEDPKGIPNNLMPYITQVASGKLKRLRVFGNDYPTPDGTGVRDYIHVVDLAKGHLKALEYSMANYSLEAFNLGTGKGYSVLEVIKSFEKVNQIEIPFEIVDRRPGDIATCYADSSKAMDILGWSASRGIEEMCRDSWNWQKKNPEGYKDKSKVTI